MKRTIVITGATSGIGFEILKALALRGDIVIGIGRSDEKIDQCTHILKRLNVNADVHYMKADLSKLSDLKETAKKISEMLGSSGLDVLINNAATVPHKKTMTQDGFETQFQVNHLAVVYLTRLLLDDLKANRGIVITTTSRMHVHARFDRNDLMAVKRYQLIRSYARSKLYNILFTKEFNRRIATQQGIRAFSVHPGLVNTDLGVKSTTKLFAKIWKAFAKKGTTPEEVVKTFLYLMDQYDSIEMGMDYFHDMKAETPSKTARNSQYAALLWDLSNEMLNIEWK